MPYRLFHNDENWREKSNMQYDILCTLNRTVHLAMCNSLTNNLITRTRTLVESGVKHHNLVLECNNCPVFPDSSLSVYQHRDFNPSTLYSKQTRQWQGSYWKLSRRQWNRTTIKNTELTVHKRKCRVCFEYSVDGLKSLCWYTERPLITLTLKLEHKT
jgi:hypothetical protein